MPLPVAVQRVLDKARSKIGTKERPVGSNNTEFGAWYGMNQEPWCAIFVSWVLWQVFGERSPVAGLQSAKGYSGTISAAAQMTKRGWLVAGTGAARRGQPGDVFIHKTTATTGHTGIVEKWNPDGSAETLEGNTDGKGSRTGGQVMSQHRPAAYMTWLFRPPYPTIAAPPVVADPIFDVWELPDGRIVQVPPIHAVLLSPAQVEDLDSRGHEQIKVLPKAASMVVLGA